MTANNPQYVRPAVTLHHHRELAQWCMYVQLFLLLFFTGVLFTAADSEQFAILCGLVAIIGSLAPVVYGLVSKHIPVLFTALAGLNIAPIWFLQLELVLPGHDAYEYIAAAYRIESCWWTALFLLLVNGLCTGWQMPVMRTASRTLSYLGDTKLTGQHAYYLTLFSFIFPMLAFLAFYGSPNTLWTAISGGRSGGGSAGGLLMDNGESSFAALMLPVSWLFQLTPLFGMITMVNCRDKWNHHVVVSAILSVLTVFIYFLGGSRGITIYVAAPLIIGFVYFNWGKGLKFWATIFVLYAVLVGAMELQVRFRGNLLEVLADPDAAAKRIGLESATTIDLTSSHRDNNTYLFCLILRGYPDKYEYQGFNDFYAILVNPIPRAFWPSKPLLIGAKDLSQQDGFVFDGPLVMYTTSLSYSVVGEAYKARGFWGLVVYALPYALFISFFDAMVIFVNRQKGVVVGLISLTAFCAFWGMRSFFAFITFLYPLFLALLMLWVYSKWIGYREGGRLAKEIES